MMPSLRCRVSKRRGEVPQNNISEKQNMKHEWKKSEKNIYLPKATPEIVSIPKMGYFTIDGKGNPNDEFFAEYIAVLYSLSYAVKMSPKQGVQPNGYYEYSVYPLEGVWDINDESKKTPNEVINKDALIFKLMIRQPDFVTPEVAAEIIERTKHKKPHNLLANVKFDQIEDGKCIQMLHLGSFDSEPISFKIMQEFEKDNHAERISRTHKEIYLSDFRKTDPENLKTVLRYKINSN